MVDLTFRMVIFVIQKQGQGPFDYGSLVEHPECNLGASRQKTHVYLPAVLLRGRELRWVASFWQHVTRCARYLRLQCCNSGDWAAPQRPAKN